MKTSPKLTIIDYALGNTFSIKNACERVGIEAIITSSKKEILSADAVLLPVMGAYGDAMETLRKLDLISVLREIAQSEKLLIGICLGIQLLMSESSEFGKHKGLGIIEGTVEPLSNPCDGGRKLKVPQIGWNQIFPTQEWEGSPLEKNHPGDYFYFVHSYFPKPVDTSVIHSSTNYGGIEFCSSLLKRNIFACIFHPERSGDAGLKVYEKISEIICSLEQG